MPQATLKIKSNEALVALSEQHPEIEFDVRGAWPTDDKLRVLVETSAVGLSSLEEALSATSALTDIEIRHSTDERILFEVSTPTPAPHGAMADSGIVPSFPLRLESGWFVGDITASREQLSAFRDELDAGGIEYRLVRISDTAVPEDALTARAYAFTPRSISIVSRRCRETGDVDRCNGRVSVFQRDGPQAGDHPVSPVHDFGTHQRRAA